MEGKADRTALGLDKGMALLCSRTSFPKAMNRAGGERVGFLEFLFVC